MTLAADSELGWLSETDRRGVALEPRRSWASSQPFERRRTPFNDEVARADHWTQGVFAYRLRTLVLDGFCAAGVVAGTVLPSSGVDLRSAALCVAAVVAWVALIALCRGYDTRELGDGPAEYQSLLRTGGMAAIALMGVAYLTGVQIRHSVVLLGVPLLVLTSILGRYFHRRLLHRARSRGEAMMRTVVVGQPGEVGRVVVDLNKAPYHGYQVVGVCVPTLDVAGEATEVPVIGAVADVPQIVVDRAIDVVVVAGSSLSGEALRRLSWALDRAGAQLIVAPDLVEITGPRLHLRPTAGLSLLEVEIAAPRRRLLAKTVLDRTIGAGLLLLVSPLIAAAAIVVRLSSRGPAFYRQTRVGVDGSTFTMWKLRSMYVDAEARRAALLAQSEGAGVLFKMREDPRVTPVGRILRRFSIDELPQLLNVVTGDMSLVGPRPPLLDEVADYADAVHRRLRVKPGLTGLWQVSGRSDLSWEESVRLDLRYVDNWSVAMDLTILWKTGRAVLGGSGAY